MVIKQTKRKPTGAAAKGPGPGRPKGSKNKLGKTLKEMILGALDAAGGQQYLMDQAALNPNSFLTLLGKVLPSEVRAGNPDGSAFSQFTPEQLLAAAAAIARKRE